MNKKSVSLQILRIIATIGVFNGHFLGLTLSSKESLEFLSFLRNGWVSRTALCVLYQGDTNVKLFFVISGFLLVFSLKKYRGGKVFFNRYIELVSPAVIVSILCAISWKIQEMGRVHIEEFNLSELLMDISKITIRGGIPYYSYQLWFINSLIRCIALATVYYEVVKNKKTRDLIFPILLFVFFVKTEVYFSFFMGMFVAEILEMRKLRCFGKEKSKYWVIISLLCIAIFPFTFNENNLSIHNANILSICFAILILGVVNIENHYEFKIEKSAGKIINFLDRNTFSFYVLHVLIQKTFSNNIYIWMYKYISNEKIVILLDWIITIVFLWGVAELFTKYILKNIRVLIKK